MGLERYMDVFLARQPIFNVDREIVAYEILYRSGSVNSFSGEVQADAASSKVIFNTFQNFGLETITSGYPAFINFSATLIEEEVATLFPKEHLVVELLETVEPTLRIVGKCRELKEAGYHIALDDFVYSPAYEPLLDLASIVKVDFRETNPFEIRKLRARLLTRDCVLLAEKVETWEEFHLATELGFTLFQGYFFEKPEILRTSGLSPLELHYMQLVAQVNQSDLDYFELARTISMDVFLTYNLLKLANSAMFAQRNRVTTVEQALVLLGEREIRKWVTLIALQGMSVKQMDGPVSQSLIRARFAQLLAQKTALSTQHNSLYLTGLFSLLDVMLQRPLATILAEVQAQQETKEALLRQTGPFAEICKAVLAYEKGDWDQMVESADNLRLDGASVAESYVESIRWHPLTAASRLQIRSQDLSSS